MPAHYFKEWRKHRGMTQLELARAMGISRSYLTMIERGDRRYDQSFLEAAAAALGATPAELIRSGPGGRESVDAMLEHLADADRERIEAAVRAMIQPTEK